MDKTADLVVSTAIGAIVSGLVKLFFEYLKAEFDGKKLWEIMKNTWPRFLLYLVIGLAIGFLGWTLIYPRYQKELFTFEQGPESWEPLLNPDDAAIATGPDLNAKALRAEYNFAQTDPNNPDPRATFYYDNFNDTWSGYKTFNLEVANPSAEHLEMTFSVDVEGCFHEFGRYQNLFSGESTIVSFDFTKPKFKTCKFPGTFDQSLDTTQEIGRIYLIIGTNESPADFDGDILIDNIRLKKNVWFLWLGVGAFVLVAVVVIALLEHQYRKYQKRSDSSKKGDPHANPIS